MNGAKLPPNVDEIGNFLELATLKKVFETGITIGMQLTSEVFEMISWPTTLAIGCVAIEGRRMWIASPSPFVTQINP